MTYEEWNLALGQHFFNEEMAGRQVLLYANEDLIKKIGGADTALKDFIAAIHTGPPGTTRSGLCQKAVQAEERWRDRTTSYPPYLAHLVLFVIAAGTADDFADHAYYPRLWRLLGEDKTGAPPSFGQMIDLWSDLEKWCREDRHEELGQFAAWPRSGWIHVGMPWSQLILSDEERTILPRIFYLAEFDPTAPPATEVLIRDLISHGREHLRRQTIKLLSSTAAEDKTLRNALAEFVLEELSRWDGEVPSGEGGGGPAAFRVQTGLRICFDIDGFTRNARSYFRFKATRPFPTGGLHFDTGTQEQAWECTETYQGWSTPLALEAAPGGQRRIDAAQFDWKRSLVISDSETGWRARLRASPVRLFFKGARENLPGWVEGHKLQRECDFLLLATVQAAPAIREWGASACEAFQAYDLHGLPGGWQSFYGKKATRSCPDVDVLSLSPEIRVALSGGIKTGRGNTYFDFAPPAIVIENYSSIPQVTVHGAPVLPAAGDEPLWKLPPNLPLLTPIVVQVDESGKSIKRILRLQGPDMPAAWDTVPHRDSCGRILAIPLDQLSAQGGAVHGPIVMPPLPARPHLPTYLSSRIIFIGRTPGEIREWPEDDLPDTWHPVWALARVDRENWQVNFCGTAEHLTSPDIPRPLPDHSRVKAWKKSLWNMRRHTEVPDLPRLRELWKRYVKAAENV